MAVKLITTKITEQGLADLRVIAEISGKLQYAVLAEILAVKRQELEWAEEEKVRHNRRSRFHIKSTK